MAVFHGVTDKLFPIDQTSRVIVPQIRKVLPSSKVSYVEGAYGHEAPPAVLAAGLNWALAGKPLASTKVAQERGSRVGL